MPTPTPARKLTAQVIQQDVDAFNGLGSIPTYATQRSEATPEALKTAYQTMQAQRQAEKEREAIYQAAVDATRKAEWEFHSAVLAMKEIVRGQFGSDSNEARAVGFKKKSERKKPVRKKAITTTTVAAIS